MEFRTEPVFSALKSLLGVVEDQERRQQLESYIDAARMAVDRALFDVLSQFADGVNEKIATHYEVVLQYRPGALDLDVRSREPGEPAAEPWSMSEGDVEKITLRLPAELKDLATDAAAKAGLSVNAWFIRMVARAVRSSETAPEPERWRGGHRRGGHFGKRLSGWVGPEE